ncbi:MAG: hypothetical protein Q9210_000561 [Variospora velana]
MVMTFHLGCICAVVNSYYRIKLERTKDKMWDTVPVLITTTIEINVGIAVGCMPYLAPMMRSGTSKLARTYSSLKTMLAVYIPVRKKAAGQLIFEGDQPEKSTSGARKAPRAYLETRMLHGADGKGKFLQSGTFQQKSWWQKGTPSSHSVGATSTTCYSEA